MNVVAIIQARMGSTRLPGKVMMPLTDGRPMILHVVERLRRASLIDQVVVATSVKDQEQPLVDCLDSAAVPLFRGAEQDVLSRYAEAASLYNADVVVRITADCPLISPEITDRVVGHFVSNSTQYDYVANTLTRSYPRGLDTEVFSVEALKKANDEATASSDREHVTMYIWRQPDLFRLGEVVGGSDQSHLRWTVDEKQDYILVQEIYNALWPENPQFDYEDILALLISRPELERINQDIEQKNYG